MDDPEWIRVRTTTTLVGVPQRDGNEKTVPAGEECELPRRDALRHAAKGQVTILEKMETP